MAEGWPVGRRSDLQVFLSIKILTIRFYLFLGPGKKGKGMPDRSFFMARKEIIIPPPSLPVPRLLHAWEAGRAFQPDLLRGQLRQAAGAGLWGCSCRGSTDRLRCIFLGSSWASETGSIPLRIREGLCTNQPDQATFQSNPENFLLSSPPPSMDSSSGLFKNSLSHPKCHLNIGL